MKIKADYANVPQWKEVMVKSKLPKQLECLDELAHNMWWAWNYEARDLWRSLDEELYEEVGHNPVMLLERLSYDRKQEIEKDKNIMKCVKDVYKKFRAYMDVKPDKSRPSVAYFSMEYGLNQVLKIYSGGLGMLAGDYLKEASDSNVDMCAVGFLYRFGYFKQSLSMDGQQIANYEAQNFNSLPIERQLDADGNHLVVDVPYMNYQVHAYVWRVNVGRIPLYLLDTDNEMNSEFDKPITHSLYGGDWENRLKQEILLGIGGMLTLKKLGIQKEIYHCNEGHAALCNLQRLCDYVHEGLSFNQALELVRASSLYTVHTPVPAGHDYFDESIFGKYMGGYPQMLGITWDEFIGMGRQNPDDHSERFCMSIFACNTCQEVNGVSKLHGWVSQKMFAPIWNGYYPEENHVGYVTNGVHFPSWAATEWRQLYAKYFDKNFMGDQSNEKIWHAIYDVPDEEIWATRMALKKKLVDYIRDKGFVGYWFTYTLMVFFVIYYIVSLVANKMSAPARDRFFDITLCLVAVAGLGAFMALSGSPRKELYHAFSILNVCNYFQYFVFGLLCKRHQAAFELALRDNRVLVTCMVVFVACLYLLFQPRIAPMAPPLVRKLCMHELVRYSGLIIVFAFFFHNAEPTYAWSNVFVVQLFVAVFLSLLVIALCLLISRVIRMSDFLGHYLLGAKRAEKEG